MKENNRIQWHPAFCSAMQLELIDNANDLEFHREYSLSRKPLAIDLFVVTKRHNAVIKSPIGEHFRKYNIIEYKSPQASMNIDTFFKANAYASLFKSSGDKVDAYKSEDITVTFVRHKKPKKLIKTLISMGYTINKKHNGIYCISGSIPFYEQLIVASELDEDKHIWLLSMQNKNVIFTSCFLTTWTLLEAKANTIVQTL